MSPEATLILLSCTSFKFGLNPAQESAETFYQIYQTVFMGTTLARRQRRPLKKVKKITDSL